MLPGRRRQVRLTTSHDQARLPLKRLLLTALLLSTVGFSQTKPAPALPTQATVESFLQHYWGYNPELKWKVNAIAPSQVPGMAEVLITFDTDPPQRMRLYVTADGEHAIVGDAIPFGPDPFKDERETLKSAEGPALGSASPAVLIVEFSDLQCPHCRMSQPTLDRLVADVPEARLVFQHFPLPTHDWAEKAARYAQCTGWQKDPAPFWKFVRRVYEEQENIKAADADVRLMQLVGEVGADPPTVRKCADAPAAGAAVKKAADLGLQLNVSGTPTVFINGRRISSIGSLPYEELKAIVQHEVKLAKQAAAAP